MTEQRLIELVHQAATETGYILDAVIPTEPIPLCSLSWLQFLLLVEEETGKSIDPRQLSHKAWSVRELKQWLEHTMQSPS